MRRLPSSSRPMKPSASRRFRCRKHFIGLSSTGESPNISAKVRRSANSSGLSLHEGRNPRAVSALRCHHFGSGRIADHDLGAVVSAFSSPPRTRAAFGAQAPQSLGIRASKPRDPHNRSSPADRQHARQQRIQPLRRAVSSARGPCARCRFLPCDCPPALAECSTAGIGRADSGPATLRHSTRSGQRIGARPHFRPRCRMSI